MELAEKQDVIILGSIFGFLAVINIIVLTVLIRNHNRFLKRLQNLEANSDYRTNWTNPLKGANWAQRSNQQGGQHEPNFAPRSERDLYDSNTGRQSFPQNNSTLDRLQNSFSIPQEGNFNPMELARNINPMELAGNIDPMAMAEMVQGGDYEMISGIIPTELPSGMPSRSALFSGVNRITKNPLFKDKKQKQNGPQPQYPQNRTDKMYY